MFSMKHFFVGVGSCAALCMALGCSSGSAQHRVEWQSNGVPRHSDPNNPWWRYQFVYHPREQVYFEPCTATYYWFADNQWHEGPELPHWFSLDSRLARVVHTWNEKPYMSHNTALAMGSPLRPIRSPFPSGDMTGQNEMMFASEGCDGSAMMSSESNASSSNVSGYSEMSGTSDWGFDQWGNFEWNASGSTTSATMTDGQPN